MNDPYHVLGVSPTATDEEIKKAYHNLARKYHPDRYRDSDLAGIAEEKMKEINSAYDEIQKMRASGTSSGSSSHSSSSSSGHYAQIRTMINSRMYIEAYRALCQIDTENRGAEWHYLMGCTCLGLGKYLDAQQYLDTACGMDPSNLEYRTLRENIRQRTEGFGSGYRVYPTQNSGCDLCSTLLCADCLCSCLGGGRGC